MIAIQYPALAYAYGPFPAVPGMSRPRSEILGRPNIGFALGRPDPAPAVVLADTPAAQAALDAALLDCFHAAGADPDPARRRLCLDPAQWLTDREIFHAAALAGCAVQNAPAPADLAPVGGDPGDLTTSLAGC